MKLQKFENKKIAILGFGLENQALVCFLIKKKVNCRISILNATDNVKPLINEMVKKGQNRTIISRRIGAGYDHDLIDFDIISRVAGYPLSNKELQKAIRAGIEVTSPTKLFFELCPTKKIIGVTGTKGKGTTASLIVAILKAAKKKVFFGGNIGIAMFSFLDKIGGDDHVVLELSSFQLEDLEKSPHIAVVTNFSKDHLKPADPNNPNCHKTMKRYWHAKENIFSHQKRGDYFVANEKLEKEIGRSQLRGKMILFSKSDLKSGLVGEHNKENVAAAVAVANILKIKDEIIRRAVSKFRGLEYRIEFVAEKGGAKYYNDTFATTPEAAITAIKSFDDPIILLAGGADKGSSFKEMAKLIIKKVKHLILFTGLGSDRLWQELHRAGFNREEISRADSMGAAFKAIRKRAKAGDIVLLSTGCASFGSFRNYKERGRLFNEEVAKLDSKTDKIES